MIHPQLEAKMRANRALGYDMMLPVIVFWTGKEPVEIKRDLSAVDLIRDSEKWTAFHAGIAAIRELDQLGNSVYLDKRIQLAPRSGDVDAKLADVAGLIGADAVWSKGITGRGILVGIADTGIDADHPALGWNRVKFAKDFTDSGSVQDQHGHSSHVAGIVGSSDAKYKGIAPGVDFAIARVLDKDGGGSESGVMAGVEWLVKQGVRVINLSLGSDGSCDGTDALSLVCDAAVDKGIVVCVAAGNAGPGRSTVGSPGCAKKVICVGASDKSDRIADFSSRGPTADGRTAPTLVAPGVNIVSCRAAGTSMGTVIDEYYTMASGTSMATPCNAGVVALMLQANPSATPARIKDDLMATCKPIDGDDNTQGAGRVNALLAVERVVIDDPTPKPPEPPGQGCVLGQLAQVFRAHAAVVQSDNKRVARALKLAAADLEKKR